MQYERDYYAEIDIPHYVYLRLLIGGTTAGIVVGRLAAADPSLRILLLETGPHTQEDLAHLQPARYLTHLQPGSKTVRNVVARPSEHLDGRQLAVQCGQCVGGGSSVNCKFSGFDVNAKAPHRRDKP